MNDSFGQEVKDAGSATHATAAREAIYQFLVCIN